MLTTSFEHDQNVLTSELPDILHVGEGTQDDGTIARRLYDIGQAGFRHGIPLAELVRAIHEWEEQSAAASSHLRPNEQRHFCEFVTHFLTRGYEDAMR